MAHLNKLLFLKGEFCGFPYWSIIWLYWFTIQLLFI